jgi:hypothetical protein
MPTFSNTPPENPRGCGLPLQRVQPGKSLTCLSISSDLIGTKTHYWHGRTTPCEEPTCKPCAEGMPWRWHAYLACILGQGHPPFILELTAQAAQRLVEYRAAHGTLRGCRIHAARANYAKNSRIVIECTPYDMAKIIMPDEPDIARVLARVWNLPTKAVQPTGHGGLADAVQIDSDAARQATELPIGAYAESIVHRITGVAPPSSPDGRRSLASPMGPTQPPN